MSRPVVRCFWAVCPPDENLEQVSQLVRALKRPLSDLGLKVTWMARESYHITLSFLGDVQEERLGAMVEHVKSQLLAAPLATAPQVELWGLGVFPGPQRPHVVFVDCGEPEENGTAALAAPRPQALTGLAQRLAGWLAPLGFAPEVRPFYAHLTIGRVRGVSAECTAGMQELLQRHAPDRHGAPFAAASLILYESQSTPSGPRYLPLVRLPLAPGDTG